MEMLERSDYERPKLSEVLSTGLGLTQEVLEEHADADLPGLQYPVLLPEIRRSQKTENVFRGKTIEGHLSGLQNVNLSYDEGRVESGVLNARDYFLFSTSGQSWTYPGILPRQIGELLRFDLQVYTTTIIPESTHRLVVCQIRIHGMPHMCVIQTNLRAIQKEHVTNESQKFALRCQCLRHRTAATYKVHGCLTNSIHRHCSPRIVRRE